MTKERLYLLLAIGFAAAFTSLAVGVVVSDHTNTTTSSCQTFTRKAQPGLFETFQGKVCTTSPGVKRIAANYNLCVKQTGSTPQCGWDLLGFFASSGAYPDDAAKAELLVLRAAHER